MVIVIWLVGKGCYIVLCIFVNVFKIVDIIVINFLMNFIYLCNEEIFKIV